MYILELSKINSSPNNKKIIIVLSKSITFLSNFKKNDYVEKKGLMFNGDTHKQSLNLVFHVVAFKLRNMKGHGYTGRISWTFKVYVRDNESREVYSIR